MNIINLTPHPIAIIDGETTTTIPSSGVARVTSTQEVLGKFGGIPVVSPPAFSEVEITTDAAITGVPVIVSMLAAPRMRHDAAVFSPDTGPASVVRDDTGRIIGVRRLVRWS